MLLPYWVGWVLLGFSVLNIVAAPIFALVSMRPRPAQTLRTALSSTAIQIVLSFAVVMVLWPALHGWKVFGG